MNILVSGLGGGLDVVNSLLPYFAAEEDKKNVFIGSIRPIPLSSLENHVPFGDSGTLVNSKTTVAYRTRFIEPEVSKHLGKEVFLFSRKYFGRTDLPRLRNAIEESKRQYAIKNILFVDAGGDSLIFKKEDVHPDGEKEGDIFNPFAGGDAESLSAIEGMQNVYLGIVSVGLDILEEKFHENLALLQEQKIYKGKINLVTGERKNYCLEQLISFSNPKKILANYSSVAKKMLVFNEQQISEKGRMISHTAPVTYYAMQKEYGMHRTYVPWEPKVNDELGVIVKPEHSWMYFFDAGKINKVKKEIQAKIETSFPR